jgi:hypothetical protein
MHKDQLIERSTWQGVNKLIHATGSYEFAFSQGMEEELVFSFYMEGD